MSQKNYNRRQSPNKKRSHYGPMNGSKYSAKEIAKKDAEDKKKEELDRIAKQQAVFAKAKDFVTMRDLTKSESRTYTVYSKETFRQYIKNPKNYEDKLRDLSCYLYRMSYEYRRIIHYYASMTDLNAVIGVPNVSMTKTNNANKILKDYEKVMTEHQKLNLASQIDKLLTIAWREDAVYGYIYEDDTGAFIMPLESSYCKISSQNYDGTFNFAFDFTYFRQHPSYLEYWDKSFNKMYNKYVSDTSLRWQELDPTRTFCIKINSDDPLLCIPPFVGLFENIIDLIDLQSIQSVKNSLSAYKMLVMVDETMEKATEPDSFTVDLDTAAAYYKNFENSLPPEVSAALSPLKIQEISFEGNTSDDVDMLSNSTANLFDKSGSTLLLKSKLEGTTAFEAALIADTTAANTKVLPQIQAWENRYLGYVLGNIGTKVKYLNVSPYTRRNELTNLLTAAQYGLPVKQMCVALCGLSPTESYSMQYLEEQVLKCQDWLPLQSSHTQTGNESTNTDSGKTDDDTTRSQGGRPTGSGGAKKTNSPQDTTEGSNG